MNKQIFAATLDTKVHPETTEFIQAFSEIRGIRVVIRDINGVHAEITLPHNVAKQLGVVLKDV